MRDGLLLGLTLVAGAVDAVSYLGLGRVFTANMTGNLVLLGLAIGQGQVLEALRSVVAFLGFAAGAMLGGWVVGAGQAARSGPPESPSCWAEFVVLAVFLLTWLLVGAEPSSTELSVLITLSAAAMGVQSAAGRRLGSPSPGVSTTVFKRAS